MEAFMNKYKNISNHAKALKALNLPWIRKISNYIAGFQNLIPELFEPSDYDEICSGYFKIY